MQKDVNLMNNEKNFIFPDPILDLKEQNAIDALTERYNKLVAPRKTITLVEKTSDKIPVKVKELTDSVKSTLTEQELLIQVMKVVTDGFHILEQNVSKFTISEKTIIKNVNKIVTDYEITELSQFCFARSYDLAKQVNKNKTIDLSAAFAQGAGCGFFGFAGIPFNLAFSMLLYYRAVQSVAMSYGYDVKGDAAELVIASEVFSKALTPKAANNNELSITLAKIMAISKGESIKHTVKTKTWAEIANSGSIELLLVQMRALANSTAQKALTSSGKKGLEESLFRDVLEQIGKQLTKKNIQKAVPYISAAIGALMDTSQMNKVLEFADVFYQKRFILEKADRLYIIAEQSSVSAEKNIIDI